MMTDDIALRAMDAISPGMARLIRDVRMVECIERLTDAECAEVVGAYALMLDHAHPAVLVLESVVERLRRTGLGSCSTRVLSGAVLPACRECDSFEPCEHDRGET